MNDSRRNEPQAQYSMGLSDEQKAKVTELIAKYPQKQAVTLPALHIAHDENRCVSFRAMEDIAELLGLSPAEVYDSMSFYQFYREENNPLGKHRIWVCRSLPCQLRGAEALSVHAQQRLQIRPGQTTADGIFSLEEAECIGACDGAPSVLVNDCSRNNISTNDFDNLIEELRQQK